MLTPNDDGIKTCKCLKGHCAHYQSDFDRFVEDSALLTPQKEGMKIGDIKHVDMHGQYVAVEIMAFKKNFWGTDKVWCKYKDTYGGTYYEWIKQCRIYD